MSDLRIDSNRAKPIAPGVGRSDSGAVLAGERGGYKEERGCPLCGSLNVRRTKLIDVESLVPLWREWAGIDIRPEFRGVRQIEQWNCAECTVTFFSPQFLAGSPELYSQLDGFEWYYRPQKWEHDAALEDLTGCKRTLEIGCGTGSFMALVQERLGIKMEGLELNPKATADALRRGLPVREARVEDLARELPSVYDAICSFQVLEHVPSPREFLEACCTLLKPGGRLLLGVPNAESYIRHMVTASDMPPHHMTRWTADVFGRVQKKFPLKLVRTACEPLAEYQVEWYLDAYAGILWRHGLGFLVRPWIRTRAIRFLRHSGMRRFLTGETIYVSYVRG
jgi:2-polyprenyl-3-methyl-5-hydroxy-6-metoxy-1,4-benzoquinol methylase